MQRTARQEQPKTIRSYSDKPFKVYRVSFLWRWDISHILGNSYNFDYCTSGYCLTEKAALKKAQENGGNRRVSD